MRCDLELEISSSGTPGLYEVSVDSPAGAATGTFRLDAGEVLGRRRELAASVLASAVTSRSALPALELPVREVGTSLFRSLFVERVYGRYAASLQESARRGEPLRVVLRLRSPELAGLPWEAMFDAEAQEYLCQREPVVRYVETAHPVDPLTVEPPLRVLGLVAAPRDLPSLDAGEERNRLAEALRDLAAQGLVDLVWAPSGSWPVLQEQLQNGPWHILHVIGHGSTDSSGRGLLALEDERTAKSSLVSASRFARLLHACRPVPRLVVLNSCSSGESSGDDPLSSTAASLVHSGISAAVAMQFAVTDPAALAFARGFYRALARNTPVDEAVRLGRIAIVGTSEQTLEWLTPVLYLRTDDARLFNLAVGTVPPQVADEGAKEEIAREAAVYGLYVQALAAIRTEQYGEAVTLLDSLLTLDPDYRDAAARREQAARIQHLISEYAQARAAEERGDWEEARRRYHGIVQSDAGYRDASARYESCRRRQEVSSLQDELRLHAAEGRWSAVILVGDQLAALDPAAADPEGIVTEAKRHTAQTPPHTDVPPDVPPDVRGGAAIQAVATPQIEQPTSGPSSGDGASGGSRGRGRRTTYRWALVAAASIAAVVAVVAWPGGRDTGGRASQESPAPSETPSKTPGETTTITCWNGRVAGTVAVCPLPVGRAGLAAVFPSLDDACGKPGEIVVTGKVEVFVCDYGEYMIRYTRWRESTDRVGYYDEANPGARRARWLISGARAGLQWTSFESSPRETKPFQWSATYKSFPYSVSVEAVSDAARSTGVARVKAAEPSEVGLRH